MPQVQYLDIPNIGTALGKIGGGFLDEVTNKYQQSQEQDAIQNMLSQLDPEASEEDVIKSVFGAPGIGMQSKQTLAGQLSQAKKNVQNRKSEAFKAEKEEEKMNMEREKLNLKREEMGQKRFEEYNKKVEPLNAAMDRVNQMRKIRAEGRLGFGIGAKKMLRGKAAENAAEYEQLGKSLISFATNIPIRNRLEFETLAEKLYDPSLSDADAFGILNAMERIIQGVNRQVNVDYGAVPPGEGEKQRPSLDSFRRTQ